MVSQNNLKQITLALHNYHDVNGCFPPAVVRDKDGRPLYSWRLLVLPYLEAGDLYARFKLDEAWDGPHNRELLAEMPKVFAPPFVRGLHPEPYTTFYQVFVGNETAFDSRQEISMPDDFSDLSRTILVIEAGEAVPWTMPVDLPYEADRPVPSLGGIFNNERSRFSISPHDRVKGFNMAMADGSVRFVRTNPPSIAESALRGLIVRNGPKPQLTDW
jgi:prepilin-type processing-associated H-X9-DG protein